MQGESWVRRDMGDAGATAAPPIFTPHFGGKSLLVMAIKLNASHRKKLGLPRCSSHSFSVSVEVELAGISQVEAKV